MMSLAISSLHFSLNTVKVRVGKRDMVKVMVIVS